MKIGQMILGILLFALATAVLYVWGLKKSVGQREDLDRSLMSACGSRVVRYLKKHDTITEAETAALIEGMTVGPFWSRQNSGCRTAQRSPGRSSPFCWTSCISSRRVTEATAGGNDAAGIRSRPLSRPGLRPVAGLPSAPPGAEVHGHQ